ncbi:hypothetical protein QR98_0074520 [Sarcoptes scabiei]|nr:hypothetical protein QR98_0074520 [Sarcoptes scabiei]
MPSLSSSTTSSNYVGNIPATSGGNYLGQTSIHTSPDYNYNWFNYQNYPQTGVLYPSGSLGGYGGIGGGGLGSSIYGGSTGPLTSFLPATSSFLRSWWTRKFQKLGLRAPGSLPSSSSPCTKYWSSSPSLSHPCPASNLCCLPPLIVQTTVESTPRPTYSESVTYPSASYLYSPNSYKSSSSLQPQGSEHLDEVVESS